MITTKRLIKSYGEKAVLNNVTLELPEGQFIAFIGSNGAGKSTLISVISRTLAKNSGEVFVEGKSVSDWNTRELSKVLSILRQSNTLNVKLTIRELVSFGRFPYSQGRQTAEDKDKIDDAIRYMELEDLQHRYLDELSGGQRQMAFIAMIIAQDTKYMFLDEPLNNLDMRHSVQIMQVLKRLVEERKKTVMVVIHDINFVSCYADYVVAMKDGEIVKQGKTVDLIEKQTLSNIYDMDINVQRLNDMNVCLYYQ